jgi:hypothetical protein
MSVQKHWWLGGWYSPASRGIDPVMVMNIYVSNLVHTTRFISFSAKVTTYYEATPAKHTGNYLIKQDYIFTNIYLSTQIQHSFIIFCNSLTRIEVGHIRLMDSLLS